MTSPGGRATTLPEGARQGVILVLYYSVRPRLRANLADHLYAFRRYSGRRCVYVNLAVRSIPAWIDRIGVDLVIFQTLLLSTRWDPPTFRRLRARLAPVRRLRCTKVAQPQDEFIYTDPLVAFIREFEVDQVLTCAPQSEWRTIYGSLVDGPTSFVPTLTGYLDPGTVARIERMATDGPRSIDIGYRASRPIFSLGRHAQLKPRVGEVFADAAPEAGLRADISMSEQDTLHGDDWYRFLLSCRWTIGVEGGASLLDRDGALRSRVRGFLDKHPKASFDEVEEACFPGVDGELKLFAVSPRHLEACATRTAQALVEGAYGGILQAGVHYLPIAKDFSNVNEVLTDMSNEELRTRLADRAHTDIVGSDRFTYPAFVRELLASLPRGEHARAGIFAGALAAWDDWLDGPSWALVMARARLRRSIRSMLSRMGLLDAVLRHRAAARARAEG